MRKLINDDDFDPRMLKDGESYRVPMRMMDAVSRDVAKHFAKPAHITDQFGNDGLALNRPGYRHIASGPIGDAMTRLKAQRDAQAAYAEWEQRQSNAWKDDAVLDAEDPEEALRDAKKAADSMDAYAEYVREMTNAWRQT